MNIDNIKSNLQMKNFYFRNYFFSRAKVIEDGEFNIDLQRKINNVKEHEYEVVLTIVVKKQDMELTLTAQADFLYKSDEFSMEEAIIKANTIAIMFPFIRSQITLLTSQPGMTPIVLPTINTQRFE